jgi:hypothetical protein
MKLTGAVADTVVVLGGYEATPGALKLTGATATVTGIPIVYEATPGALKLTGLSATAAITTAGFFLNPDDGDFWEFAKWGDKMIAVGGHSVAPKIITFGGALFSDLSGSPPNSRHIAIVRNFIVLGNINEDNAIQTQRVRWSGINDETIWTTNKAKQADYQDLRGNQGKVQAIRGGQYGVIVLEYGTWVMEYIGPPQVFSFHETLPAVGTPAPNSVVQVGDTLFMLAQNGFIGVQGGRRILEIGSNKVNKWLFDNLDGSFTERLVGAWDRRRRLIMWVFPTLTSSNGLPDHGIIFDLETGKWSYFTDEVEWVYSGLGESLTLEELDAISTSVDALPSSLDSAQWTDNDLALTGFDENHKSGAFDGTAMDAVIDTAEIKPMNGRAMVSRLRLEVDSPSAATVQSGTRASQSDSVDLSSEISQASDGSYPMRRESRYHRFRVNITGGFEKAQGVTIEEMRQTGNR